jgi:hypothetical protein
VHNPRHAQPLDAADAARGAQPGIVVLHRQRGEDITHLEYRAICCEHGPFDDAAVAREPGPRTG